MSVPTVVSNSLIGFELKKWSIGNNIKAIKIIKSKLTTLLFFFKKFEKGESVLSTFILILDYIFFFKRIDY